jgi:hypothetical protein
MKQIWRRLRLFDHVFLLVLAPVVSLIYAMSIDDVIFSRHRDFGVFWTAAVLLWRGETLLLFDPAAFRLNLAQVMGSDFPYLPFPYPPHSLFLLAPLAFLPYLTAFTCWLVAGLGGILVTLWQRLKSRWHFFIAFLLCPASAVNMATGQNGFLSAILLCGGLLALERRPILAGLLFGLLSYKPQLGLLIPFLLMAGGHWRAFWSASLTVTLLVAASALLFGVDSWLLYVTKSGPQQLEIAQHWVGRFQTMSPTYFMAGRLLGCELWLAWTIQIVMSLVAAGAAIWAFRQPSPFTLRAALVMVATFLISPYVLTYDMTIVSIAILLAATCFAPAWWEYLGFALAWLLPALTLPAGMPVGPIILTILFFILLRRIALTREVDAPTALR